MKEMSWKTDLCQGKIEFPGVHTKNLLIIGHQVPILSLVPINIFTCYFRKFGGPLRGASIYNLNLRHWWLKDISFKTQMYVHGYLNL